jgi:CBS domain-containing protein
MRAAAIMTRDPIVVHPESSIMQAVQLMLQRKISGLPVTNGAGELVGIITEGDLLRRVETGTMRRRPRWIQFFLGAGRMADEYSHACGRKVSEVMNSPVRTVDEEASLDQIVRIMERHQVKRVPVMRGKNIVGIVSRSNLLRALATLTKETKPSPVSDTTIRQKLVAELKGAPWAPVGVVDVVVRNGVVHLWGTIFDERQRQGIRVAAENTPGVQAVEDHLIWVEPHSGMVVLSPDDTLQTSGKTA